jgi:hypothetical protein
MNRRGLGLAWSYMGLMEARRMTIDATISNSINDLRNDFVQRVYQRFFRMEAELVGVTTGASVPLADGGVADANYVPRTSSDGEEFASSHDHFLRLTPLAQAALESAVDHLAEHDHMAPFEIRGSEADIATWTATASFTGFKPPLWRDIAYQSSATERAMIENVGLYEGYIETRKGLARLRTTTRIPTTYFGVYKSYGTLDPRNPVRLRAHPQFGFGYKIVPGVWASMPEQFAVVAFFYGVGIGDDRTNGVAVEIDASGDYATPVIT